MNDVVLTAKALVGYAHNVAYVRARLEVARIRVSTVIVPHTAIAEAWRQVNDGYAATLRRVLDLPVTVLITGEGPALAERIGLLVRACAECSIGDGYAAALALDRGLPVLGESRLRQIAPNLQVEELP